MKPKRIILELTNACNLECIMCARTHIDFNRTFLEMAVVEKLKGFFETAEEVTLFGYGESLLNPEFSKILEYLSHYPNLHTYLVTNGLLLSRYAEVIVKSRMTFLSISVDGASEETYKRIRKGGRLQAILDALKKIAELKKKYNSSSPYLRFIFVAMKDNVRELPDLVDVAAAHGVSEIKVEYLVAHSPEMVDQSLYFHRELLGYFDEAAMRAVGRGIKIGFPPRIGEDETGQAAHRECTTPMDTLFVSSNGDIRACMISNEIFGNISLETVEHIWNNEKFSAFRKRVNSEDAPHDCMFCWQASHLNVNREDAHVRLDVGIAGQKKKS